MGDTRVKPERKHQRFESERYTQQQNERQQQKCLI